MQPSWWCWWLRGAFRDPINHLGEAATGLTFRDIRVRPTLWPTSQHLACGLFVANSCNLLDYEMIWKCSTTTFLCIQVKFQIEMWYLLLQGVTIYTWQEKNKCCVYNGNLVNIRARVLLIILWALHEYFIHLRAPDGVWIMQLVSSWGKRTVAEPPNSMMS